MENGKKKAGGGNASDRAKQKTAEARENRLAEHVAQKVIQVLDVAPISSDLSAIPAPPEPSRSKLREFWTSTPAWTAVGAMIGVFAAHISLWLLVLGVWVVILIDFIRARFFEGWKRIAASALFAVLLAVILFGTARFAPPPPAQPTLDQQLEAIAKRFPALGAQPSVINRTTQIIRAEPPKNATMSLRAVASSYGGTISGGQTYDSLLLGQKLAFNAYFSNIGPHAAEKLQGAAKVYIAAGASVETQKMMEVMFKKFASHHENVLTPTTVGSGESKWLTAFSDEVLYGDDLEKIKSGSKIVFLFISTTYSDGTGNHYQHYCRYLQSPPLYPTVWHECSLFHDYS